MVEPALGVTRKLWCSGSSPLISLIKMKITQKEHNEKIVAELSANPDLRLNKMWRMENLYWIITKDGTKEVFTMNKMQRHFLTVFLLCKTPYHRHCILKSRQLGFTTFIDIFILDEILFNTNREGLVIAHKVEDAKEIFDRKIDFALRNMSEEIQDAFFKIKRNSAKKIQVIMDYGSEEGSTSSIQVSTSGRSGTYHYLHVSEFAKLCATFAKKAEEVETGTFPAVPFDGFIFIESTAEGMAGRFYEIFQDGWINRAKITPQLSRVSFLSHFYNWQWDEMEMKKIETPIPTKDMLVCEIDWGEYQKEHKLNDIEITYYYMKWLQLGGATGTNTVKKLNQEYPTTPEEAFLATGQTYFSTSKVVSLMSVAKNGVKGELFRNAAGKIEFIETSDGNLELFRKPEQGEQIVVGGDTAEGLASGDSQVLYAISHKTKECIGLYKSQEDPSDFINSAYNLGEFFNWAVLAVEVNKDGLWVNNGLHALGYPNLYSRQIFDDITKKFNVHYGWKTTASTRPFLLAALKAVMLAKLDGFPKALLGEMLTFIRNARGRPEAMAGKHDDIVIAAGIACAVVQELGKFLDTKQDQTFSMAKLIFGENK